MARTRIPGIAAATALAALGVAAPRACAQVDPGDSGRARPAARARVAVEFTRERFPVRGGTFVDALEDLERVGPRADDGTPRQAITTYSIGPMWNARRLAERCLLLEPRVRVLLRVRLPEWSGRGAADPAERERWDDLVARLGAHEQAHADAALDTAHRLADDLEDLSAPTCPRLVRRAHATIRRHLDALAAVQRELDGGPRAVSARRSRTGSS